MLGAMGMTTTSQIPKLRDEPRAVEWEIPDPETEDGYLLRPDFSISFQENSPWHTAAISFVQNNICRFDNSISATAIKRKSDAQILAQIGTVFKGFATKYKDAVKDTIMRTKNKNDLKGSGATKKSMEPKAVSGRQARRKKRVTSHLSMLICI